LPMQEDAPAVTGVEVGIERSDSGPSLQVARGKLGREPLADQPPLVVFGLLERERVALSVEIPAVVIADRGDRANVVAAVVEADGRSTGDPVPSARPTIGVFDGNHGSCAATKSRAEALCEEVDIPAALAVVAEEGRPR